MKRLMYIFFICSITATVVAQDSTGLPKKITVNGYIKDLQTLSFNKNFSDLVSGNLIHNRVNIKWKPSGKITMAAELRNRVFWGEEVRMNPGLKNLLRNKNEKLNLQKTWISNPSLLFHTNTERLYFDFINEKIKFRLGRQRINWGIGTTWNPNDIFNVFNFLDFDYEERPGVDGANLKYIFPNSSSTELAYGYGGKSRGSIIAVKQSLNKWNYDMQFIAGWYGHRPTVGAGWAGSIKDAGFKGEVQYFFKKENTADGLNASVESDYMFKNGWYINAGLLFNKNGISKPVQNWNEINLDLSPDNIMPTKWNIIFTTLKEVTPLLSANLGVVFSGGTNMMILLPSASYNIASNVDMNLVWQSFFIEQDNHFASVNHRCFLRMKWSF